MKIVFLDRKTINKDISFNRFKDLGEYVEYDTTNFEDTLDRVIDATVILTNKVVITEEIMEKSKNLKLICVCATGMNNIDLDAAKKINIEVKNVAGYSTNSVVQHTFSMLFHLISRLDIQDEYVKDLSWTNSRLFTNIQNPYFEIANKKWGIIGLGAIGQQVANVAKTFGANLSYYSTSGSNNNSEYKKLSLEELLKDSDIISIHSPLNKNTLNLLNKDNLKLLKDKAILLNLGRGGIINEFDLADIMNKKDVSVGLDVLKNEPCETDNPLLDLDKPNNLLITPHIAWASFEAQKKLIDLVYENIITTDFDK
jgi:lactate dehydrogenase-like 2-hydroxyacid dehydrogenase